MHAQPDARLERGEWLSLRLKRRTYGQSISSFRSAPPFVTLVQQLRQIWQLADADGDSKLSLVEFCVGMHLIVCVSKKGLPCPATRPPSLFAGSAQLLGGSPAKSVPQSPIVRPSPVMQPPSSPPSAMLPLGAVASSSEDAFRSVNMSSMDVHIAVSRISSMRIVLCLWCVCEMHSRDVSGLEGTLPELNFVTTFHPCNHCVCSALAVDLPAKDTTASVGKEAEVGTPTPELPLRTAQPPESTPSRSPTSTNVSENGSPVGDSPPSAAGMQELVAASSALLSVTGDVSTAHNQVCLRLPMGI